MPEGRKDSIAVRNGTILANRAFILLWIAAAKACWWCLEQPATSCMEHLPAFQQLVKKMSIRKLIFEMADFGAPTLKRTILYSRSLTLKRKSPLNVSMLVLRQQLRGRHPEA